MENLAWERLDLYVSKPVYGLAVIFYTCVMNVIDQNND